MWSSLFSDTIKDLGKSFFPPVQENIPVLLMITPIVVKYCHSYYKRVVKEFQGLEAELPISSQKQIKASFEDITVFSEWMTVCWDAFLFAVHVSTKPVTVVSISVQNQLRDAGGFRIVADGFTIMLGAMIFLGRPWLISNFKKFSDNMTTMRYGDTDKHVLEILPLSRTTGDSVNGGCTSKKPPVVVIFVHGGAWGSGKIWKYRLIAEGLGKCLNATAVISVGYPVYPESTILQQSASVQQAVEYITQNEQSIKSFIMGDCDGGCDKDHPSQEKISYVLAGHSSGANICALALLHMCTYPSLEVPPAMSPKFPVSIASPITPSTPCMPNPPTQLSSPPLPTTSPPLALGTKLPVDLFIGLSGVYDINKHFIFESNRGVQEASPMKAAALGVENFESVSPTVLVRSMSRSHSLSRSSMVSSTRTTTESDSSTVTNHYTIDPNDTSTTSWAANSLSALLPAPAPASASAFPFPFSFPFPYTLLLHGLFDTTVPPGSSSEFAAALTEERVARAVDVQFIPCDHMEPMLEMMNIRPATSMTGRALLRGLAKYKIFCEDAVEKKGHGEKVDGR
jgi:acetyl esterase/lipase